MTLRPLTCHTTIIAPSPANTMPCFVYSYPEVGTFNVNVDVCVCTIRYDTRCYFNVRSKAVMSQLNLPHVNNN